MSNDSTPIEDRLSAARARFPGRRLYVADSPAGDLILGKPRRQDYEAWLALILSDDAAEKAKAPRTILLACAVDPDAEGMRAALDEYPALASFPAVTQAIKFATGTAKAEAEKK
jgi:hypothetical protein